MASCQLVSWKMRLSRFSELLPYSSRQAQEWTLNWNWIISSQKNLLSWCPNATNNKYKSGSASKRKYQTRNTVKVIYLVLFKILLYFLFTINLIKKATAKSSSSSNIMLFLMELITSPECIVNQVDSIKVFNESQIQTDPLRLSKMFLDTEKNWLPWRVFRRGCLGGRSGSD